MSTQPFPSSSGAAGPSSTGSGGKRNPVLLAIGAVLAVAGIVVGVVLIGKASSSVSDNVRGMGRAPAGCSTVLDFSETGTFLVFYERKGTLPDLPGGCGGSGASFDRGNGDPPRQTLSLQSAKGDEVTIDDASGTTYNASGFAGEQVGTVKIDDAGRYTLSVSPRDANDAEYAIAVGKDPTRDESAYRAAGLGVLIAGVVLGALLIALGLRRRGGRVTTPAVPAGTWSPAAPTSAAPTWQPTAPAPPLWQPRPPEPPTTPPSGFGGPPPYAPPAPPNAPPEPPSSPFAPPRSPEP